MNHRTLAFLLCAAPLCFGDVETEFSDIKRHVQLGDDEFDFLGGELGLNIFDGFVVLGPCALDPSIFLITPDPLFCPPGTQGLVGFGDIDQDGIADPGLFFAITAVEAATQVEPFRPDRVLLLAAPPGGLATEARKSGNNFEDLFESQDNSVIVWWDVLNASEAVQQYDLTSYAGIRPYDSGEDELDRQYEDIRFDGTYTFSYPVLDDPQNPGDDFEQLVIGVTHEQTPDIFPSRGLIEQGIRITNDEDYWVDLPAPYPTLNLGNIREEVDFPATSAFRTPVDITNAFELDPRTFFTFTWAGIDGSNTIPTDTLHYSLVGVHPIGFVDLFTGACVVPPDPEFAFDIVFPPYSDCTPSIDRTEILIGTFDGQLDFPPFFFQPGEFVYLHLRWSRDLIAGFNATDLSQRSLLVPIAFVDSWESFSTFSAPFPSVGGFPFGTPVSERTTDGDFDGDGYINLVEFALFSDVNDATDDDDGDDPPQNPAFPPPPPAIPEILPEDSVIELDGEPVIIPTASSDFTITYRERPYLSSRVTVDFEYAMGIASDVWMPITEADPFWDIITTPVDDNGDEVTLVILDPTLGPQPRVNVIFDVDGETVLFSDPPVDPIRDRVDLVYLPGSSGASGESWGLFILFDAPSPSVGGFPPEVPIEERTTDGDLDTDSFTNLVEFALYSDLNSDSGDPGELPSTPPAFFAEIPGLDLFAPIPGPAGFVVEVLERPSLTGVDLTWEFALGPAGTEFFPIEGNADWAVTSVIADFNGDDVTFLVIDPEVGPEPRINVVLGPGDEVISSDPAVLPLRNKILIEFLPGAPGLPAEGFFRVRPAGATLDPEDGDGVIKVRLAGATLEEID